MKKCLTIFYIITVLFLLTSISYAGCNDINKTFIQLVEKGVVNKVSGGAYYVYDETWKSFNQEEKELLIHFLAIHHRCKTKEFSCEIFSANRKIKLATFDSTGVKFHMTEKEKK